MHTLISSIIRIPLRGFKLEMSLYIGICPILLVTYTIRKRLKITTKILLVNLTLLVIAFSSYMTFGFLTSANIYF